MTWHNDATQRHLIIGNESAQAKIREYLRGKTAPTDHDMRCFVGMVETGEATLYDVAMAGGKELAGKVERLISSPPNE